MKKQLPNNLRAFITALIEYDNTRYSTLETPMDLDNHNSVKFTYEGLVLGLSQFSFFTHLPKKWSSI